MTWYLEETEELLPDVSGKAVTRKRWTEVSPSPELEPTFEFKGESIDNYLSISHVKSKHYGRSVTSYSLVPIRRHGSINRYTSFI